MIRLHVVRHQIPDGAAIPDPGPNIRRGEVHPGHGEGDELSRVLPEVPGRTGDSWSGSTPSLADRHQGRQLRDLLRFLPLMELGQLVRPKRKKSSASG